MATSPVSHLLKSYLPVTQSAQGGAYGNYAKAVSIQAHQVEDYQHVLFSKCDLYAWFISDIPVPIILVKNAVATPSHRSINHIHLIKFLVPKDGTEKNDRYTPVRVFQKNQSNSQRYIKRV